MLHAFTYCLAINKLLRFRFCGANAKFCAIFFPAASILKCSSFNWIKPPSEIRATFFLSLSANTNTVGFDSTVIFASYYIFFFRFVVWLSECKEYSRIFFFLVGFIVCGTAQSEIIREWSECQKWIWREKNFIINPFCGRKNERESFNKANNFSIAYGNQANTQKCAFIHKFNYTECLHSLGNLAIHSAKSDRYFRISMDNTHATCYSV